MVMHDLLFKKKDIDFGKSEIGLIGRTSVIIHNAPSYDEIFL